MTPPKTFRLLISCALLSLISVHCQTNDESNVSQSPAVVPRITHGEDAPIGRFPYMCSLRLRGSRNHRCGGTLIRHRWVLTAAHCVDPNVPRSVGLSPLVYCGMHRVNIDDPEHIFRATRTIMHDSWRGSVSRGHDIALIELDRRADFDLPDVDFQGTRFESGQFLTATGWGRTHSRSTADVLQMAQSLLYVPHDQCRDYHGNALRRHMICAGFLDQDTCTGDSGGPLMVVDEPAGNISAGSPSFDLIVGITSAGAGDCDGSVPGLYTRVSDFSEWIRGVLDGTIPESPSPGSIVLPSDSDVLFRVGADDGLEDPDDTQHDLKDSVTSWSRLKRNAGYFTESGLWRGGLWRKVRDTESERSLCEIRSASHCVQWSFDERSSRAEESGTCSCNPTGTPYCASWSCESNRKDKKADCTGRGDPRQCRTRHHTNAHQCQCVTPSRNERYCSHWNCTDRSSSGYSEQEDYYCTTEDEGGEYCYQWRGNISSSYELEAALCECFVREEQYCVEWRCTERALTRCASHYGGWCSLEFAIIFGGGLGIVTFLFGVLAFHDECRPFTLGPIFSVFLFFTVPWLIGVFIWGGMVGFFSVAAIWAVMIATTWYFTRDTAPSKSS